MSSGLLASLEAPWGFWISRSGKMIQSGWFLEWVQCGRGLQWVQVGRSSVAAMTETNTPLQPGTQGDL